MGNEVPLSIAALAGSLGSITGSRVASRRGRVVAELPTSSCAGVFMGLNEVAGKVHVADPSTSPFGNIPAVYWTYTVEEEREHTRTVSHTDANGHTTTSIEHYTQWHVVDSNSHCHEAFLIHDETGSVQIRTAGAKLTARTSVSETIDDRTKVGWFRFNKHEGFRNATGRVRRTEQVIGVGDEAFIVGTARQRDDVVAPEIAKGDGEIFFISLEREEDIQGNSQLAGAVLAVIASLLVVGGSAGLLTHAGVDPLLAVLPGVVIVAIVATILWIVGTYNSLVRLVNRSERAHSLLDVQLQRRHDLVPELVKVVAASAAHEADVQEMVATLRSVDPLSTPELESTSRHLIARSEALPDLRANAAFLQLHAQLVDAENRVAAARTFIIDGAEVLTTRAKSFPATLVASRVVPAEMMSVPDAITRLARKPDHM